VSADGPATFHLVTLNINADETKVRLRTIELPCQKLDDSGRVPVWGFAKSRSSEPSAMPIRTTSRRVVGR
jgi:hypothetical protein